MNDYLLLLINGWAGRSAALDAVMVFCASYLIFAVAAIVLVCCAYLASRRQWRPVLRIAATLAAAFVLLQAAAMLALDHRPFMDHPLTQLVAHSPGASFPSDHTTASAAAAFAVLFFTSLRRVGSILLVLTAAIGFSRVFVGIHYPLDILGAWATALGGAAAVGAAAAIGNRPAGAPGAPR